MNNDQINKELQYILEGTVKETGTKFFEALVYNLCKAINTYGAWVTEYNVKEKKLKALAFWLDDKFVPHYEYSIRNTPCEPVIDDVKCVHIPDKVIDLFPSDPDLPKMNAVSYLAAPFVDSDGSIIGHLAVLHNQPLPEDKKIMSIFNIFADRASVELKRLRAVRELKERQEKLSGLIECTMDAIIEINERGIISLVNPAAEKIFNVPKENFIGNNFTNFLDQESSSRLRQLINELSLNSKESNYLWISGGLKAKCSNDNEFLAEASLSRYEVKKEHFFILILRNIQQRLEAEKRIFELTTTTEYLRDEIKELHNNEEILGNSEGLIKTLEEISDVADTDTTVLILGETGTGKELIARAIHNSSRRKNKPLIKINCAAMPSDLIESELFGHEQGAFTGATKNRIGRFKLADGGSIFLDEIGELPLSLQAKLLRVLQEKEFEPVGAAQTIKVDVRVLAATNRNLEEEVEKGNFREDLYYRLNVYPINVPPLRERGNDIILLAEKFAERFALKMGKKIEPLTEESILKIRTYNWPGNIRELQNVIERAVITSKKGWLNLSLSLPDKSIETKAANRDLSDKNKIKTNNQILQIERENIILALEKANWKVSGKEGAAALLSIPPTTLYSKIKAFKISRPKTK